jgi:non-heme chloroperoxidase
MQGLIPVRFFHRMTFLQSLPNTLRPQHTWKGAKDNRLYGDSWGLPSSPLVVLLHGGGQTRHSWRRTALNIASAGFYAVTYDARGHGDSDWVGDGDYSDAAMVQDLLCVLRSLNSGFKPVLIGASMGGITGLVATGGGPVSAAALVFADVVHVTAQSGFERVRAFMASHSQGFESLQEVAQAIDVYQGKSTAHPPRKVDGLAKNLRLGADGRLYWHWDPRFLDSRDDLAAREKRLTQCVRQLTVPTLLVRGARSDVVSTESVHEFLALCPHASHVDVADAGHMLTGDDNDVFGRMVIDFILQNS